MWVSGAAAGIDAATGQRTTRMYVQRCLGRNAAFEDLVEASKHVSEGLTSLWDAPAAAQPRSVRAMVVNPRRACGPLRGLGDFGGCSACRLHPPLAGNITAAWGAIDAAIFAALGVSGCKQQEHDQRSAS
jgi:hypothetical protein